MAKAQAKAAEHAEASVAIVDDSRFDAHVQRDGHHPECPERLTAAREGLLGALPAAQRRVLKPREANAGELQAVHPGAYVEQLRAALAGGHGHIDADTYYAPGSREAAWLAAGGAADMARAIVAGDSAHGVALLRPPGHHAEPGRAMGFCMLNNVAVAAHAALAAGRKRVAILDWDVHHGNGTQAAFYADPRVLFISLHQYPFYPGTGAVAETGSGPGLGSTLNVPLPAGSGAAEYADAMRRVVLPALARFGPDLLLVSAGFDAHRSDPLAQMQLDAACYGAFTGALLAQRAELAPRAAGIGFVLEGGYDLAALRDSVAAVARAMRGDFADLPEDTPCAAGRQAVDAAVRYAGL